MVARINSSKNISKPLNYNEQKVQQGKAEILLASGFIKDADKLNFYDKLNHFKSHTSLNEKATTNAIHISLNFDPSEKLSGEKLIAIAEHYMQKIGFGHQPYLVYRHNDAGHPHIHIVSTNIERDGRRISMHRLGANQSEKARKEIEVMFGLVKAESKKPDHNIRIVPVNFQKLIYGKSETKRAMANVLILVLNQYKFTSLPELNAILNLYNVHADRGSEGSRMHSHRGLVYRVLDDKGCKVGTPIKASAFYMKPTLALLEAKFKENEQLRRQYKKRLQNTVAWQIGNHHRNLDELSAALGKEQISVVLRYTKDGLVYGITYVDHKTKSVFNGSDLGKMYSAKAILESFSKIEKPELLEISRIKKQTEHESKKLNLKDHKTPQLPHFSGNDNVSPELSYVPFQLRKRKKKKRKRLSI